MADKMRLKEDWCGDSKKVSIWRKRETDLTFPNGMVECKHSWMWRAFIGCILIIALTFHRLPRTVVYTLNVPLTAYLNPSRFLQRRCLLRSHGSAQKCICSTQKQHCFKCDVIAVLWVSDATTSGYAIKLIRGDYKLKESRLDPKELSSLLK